jgi:hypothetical protein
MNYVLAVYSALAVPTGIMMMIFGIGLVIATKDLSFLAAGAGLVYTGTITGNWFMQRVKKEEANAAKQ